MWRRLDLKMPIIEEILAESKSDNKAKKLSGGESLRFFTANEQQYKEIML